MDTTICSFKQNPQPKFYALLLFCSRTFSWLSCSAAIVGNVFDPSQRGCRCLPFDYDVRVVVLVVVTSLPGDHLPACSI